VVDNTISLSLDEEDPFADLVIDPPVVPKHHGRRHTKRRVAGDGQGAILKPRKLQVCSVCSETGHNKSTCKRLQILEGATIGLGVM
jgi:hypothetical protein